MTAILIADDEASIRDAVSFYIRREGYSVETAKDGDEALNKCSSHHFDLIILDIMMPKRNGYEVCAAIRDEDPTIPIIFLSAKGDLIDKSMGFKLGGDDYITKPFEPVELMLRVNSCLRRSQAASRQASAFQELGGTILLDDLRIDTARREVTVGGRKCDLTAKEYEVLEFLAARPNTVFTRQQILDAVWGVGYFGSAGIVAVFIRKLREKIERDASKPAHILTEWGVGYRVV